MLRVKRALMFENGNPKQSPILVLAPVLMACAFFWAGCNGLPQSSVAASSQTSAEQSISMQPVLPGASVGSNYDEVLNVSGGRAPYNFVVSQGKLPLGLVLNPLTGGISGIPTLRGSFTFTIRVTGGAVSPADGRVSSGVTNGPASLGPTGPASFGTSGVRTYTVTVTPKVNSVTVLMSPVAPSVAVGQRIQFAAMVGNTSNTAVTWSASAGTISPNGLFTAPANASAKPIIVIASSVAETSAQASTDVTITSLSAAFAITSSSVPSAVKATPYSASLTASGGQPPYRWSIASGSLPSGLQLNGSLGTLSGSATKTGTFVFSVLGTDATSQTSQRSFSLLVSASGTCGPPAYGCSRTDQDIVQLPSRPPNAGNLKGAGTIVTDPSFGNRMVRITDANTNPSPTFVNRSYVSAASGSADDNPWNTDSTLLVVQDTGGNSFPFTFNPGTLQAARMYVSSFPTTNGLMLHDSGNWSRINPNVFYTSSGTAISKYNFTDRTNPPSPQPVYDFTSGRNCLPAGFTETWNTRGGVSGDDTVFGMAYSNGGGQGSGVYAVAYKVGSGCSILNTSTGQVGGDWGATGTINIADRWTIHNAKLSKDGNWLIIVSDTCTSAKCTVGPYFWQVGTTNVGSCGQGPHCTGHWTEGYSHFINNNQIGNQESRPLSDATAVSELTPMLPTTLQGTLDEHASWNNADSADSLPIIVSFWSPSSPFPAAWYNEITGVAADGSGKVWRFAHSFITGKSQVFNAFYGIGSVSQDGRFFLLSSDWMGTLGSESGTSSCTIGEDCRGDVFAVELN
jgi:putative Ig domain-containing protein